jgi:thiamine biosynthesis lipoprotein
MSKKRAVLSILFLVIIFFLLRGDYVVSFNTFSTIATVKLYGINYFKFFGLKKELENLCKNFENTYSVNKYSSVVYKLNSKKKLDNCSDEFIKLLKIGKKMSEKTGGKFDITCEKVLKLWGFDNHDYKLPKKKDIEKALKFVDYKKIKILGKNVVIGKGQEINLGSYAKGYAIDKVYDFLLKKGYKEFLIDFGGDIRVYSYRNRVFKIGIKAVRHGGIDGVLKLKSSQAVATSGDYERFFIKNGKRYHHIISAKTGYPSYKQCSVSVVAKNATKADILSTAFFILGYDYVSKHKNEFDFIKAVFIYEDERKVILEK